MSVGKDDFQGLIKSENVELGKQNENAESLKDLFKNLNTPKQYEKLEMLFDSSLTQLQSDEYIMDYDNYLKLKQEYPPDYTNSRSLSSLS